MKPFVKLLIYHVNYAFTKDNSVCKSNITYKKKIKSFHEKINICKTKIRLFYCLQRIYYYSYVT